MKKKIKVVIARDTEIDKRGEKFTAKCLKKCATKSKNLSLFVLEDFDFSKPVGKITKLMYKSGDLIAEIELPKNLKLKDKVFRIFGVEKEVSKSKGIKIIKNIETWGVGLIDKVLDVYKNK